MAVALPIPLVDPVTSAVRSFRSVISCFALSCKSELCNSLWHGRTGLSNSKVASMGGMVNDTSVRPRLTPKGDRTRARIVEKAAALIHERGVAGTTLEDVKTAAEVSGSQLYHYFPDKNDLVQAVIDYHADGIVSRNRQVLDSADGVEAWRKMVIAAAKRTKAKGGCALGSLVGQLAESDPEARVLIASGFDEWAAALSDGLRSL